ncbi:hypothetical protein D3C72_1855690 [compost metagenome]
MYNRQGEEEQGVARADGVQRVVVAAVQHQRQAIPAHHRESQVRQDIRRVGNTQPGAVVGEVMVVLELGDRPVEGQSHRDQHHHGPGQQAARVHRGLEGRTGLREI